ncbi:helix-turn-helix domain-containing protein [Marinilabiliaceae bacterium ANBcel2]|nr:helix-turn-helix domain-containing protein [Marinilabiliaceae bacterium ANBcel2]
MQIASNLKYLRSVKKITQQALSIKLGIKRSSLNNYENSVSIPPVEILIKLSHFFNISVDSLIKCDLSVKNSDYIKGADIRILTSTVGADNEENIELVPEKAKAGYTAGFADPEYIESLPVFRLPFLDSSKKYRTFQISGDSMLPIKPGSYVTGEFIQDWTNIKDGDASIIITINDGINFKIIENNFISKGEIKCSSLNDDYEPYTIHYSQIKEIWRFVNYISSELPEPQSDMAIITKTLSDIKRELANVKMEISKNK